MCSGNSLCRAEVCDLLNTLNGTGPYAVRSGAHSHPRVARRRAQQRFQFAKITFGALIESSLDRMRLALKPAR